VSKESGSMKENSSCAEVKTERNLNKYNSGIQSFTIITLFISLDL
jgi:hypothetical protein